MAIEDDVLVIGGGIAGMTAALSAAERGCAVRVLSFKQSTLRHASGLIDVLGYAPGGGSNESGTDERTDRPPGGGGERGDRDAHEPELEGPIVDPFDAIARLPTGHPYERVGLEAVREALLFFDAIAGDAYRGAHTDANALVPTVGGSVKPTARYPRATAPGLASDPRPTLLVGFETLPQFDAPLAAAHLRAAGVPFRARGVTVRFPGELRDDAKITRYAHALDYDESLGAEGGIPARAALAETVRPHLEGESRLGFPAVLGEEHSDVVRRDLEERLGVDVFEVPTGPPSLPGMRLEDLFQRALDEAGVRVTTGIPVVGYEADRGGDRIDRVIVDRKGREVPYRASEYVLATGDVVGKGIRSSREEVFEPIFDCYVPHPEDRYDWFDDEAFGDHPFARFGVRVDRELRPLDARGDAEFENLRAAGAVLGGYDYAAEKSGAGVSLATGYVAGRRAGEEVATAQAEVHSNP